jgi:hypothetical protein
LKNVNAELKIRNKQSQDRNEELRGTLKALHTSNEELQVKIGTLRQIEEGKQQGDEAIRLRNEQIKRSEEFTEFVKAKEVKKIRVNGKEITSRLVRVILEISGRGSVHVFEMCRNLDIPRSTIIRDIGILRGMNWVCL